MAEAFYLQMAGLTVEVRPLYDDVRRMCGGYVADAGACVSGVGVGGVGAAAGATDGAGAGLAAVEPDIVVAVSRSDIERERELSTDEAEWSDGYLETLAVLRAVAERLPGLGRLLVHGAAVSYDGRSYLFCAPSGTGKSTHIRLWRRYLGKGVGVVNGDKPILRVMGDGGAPLEVPLACGTPWSGKEGWQSGVQVPLGGICLLSRALRPGEGSIARVDPARALDRVLRQVYLTGDPVGAGLALELVDALLGRVPLYDLACDMSEGAVRMSFEAMTGADFEACRVKEEQ